MLHGFRFALGLLAAGGLISALLPGCQSGDIRARKEASPQQSSPPQREAPTSLTPGAPGREVTTQQALGVAGKDDNAPIRLDTSGKAPDDWPSEVPLYPGAKIKMSMKLERGFTLTLETPDASARVSDYYKTQLARLQQSSAVDLGHGQTLMWADPSKPLQVVLTLSPAEGWTRATLIVTSK